MEWWMVATEVDGTAWNGDEGFLLEVLEVVGMRSREGAPWRIDIYRTTTTQATVFHMRAGEVMWAWGCDITARPLIELVRCHSHGSTATLDCTSTVSTVVSIRIDSYAARSFLTYYVLYAGPRDQVTCRPYYWYFTAVFPYFCH